MFKTLRILILLLVLLTVALTTLISRWQAQSWSRTQVVTLYPINADGDPGTDVYLDRLDDSAFAGLDPYFREQAAAYGLSLSQPMRFVLGRRVRAVPPEVPRDGGVLSAISWSLRMRWWAWRETPPSSPKPDVRLFLLYHPASTETALPHSTGLEKGRLGLVHVFAERSQEGANQVVIAHESLHTFGATDKYDRGSLMPRFPDGYADPRRDPRLPQSQAELMAGRIPLREDQARIPTGLAETVVGPGTAVEIGWVK